MASTSNVNELLKALLVLSRTVDQVLEARAASLAAKEPLPPSKVRVLRLLGHRRQQSASEVAHFLGVTKPAVTQIIDSMVRSKLVVRRPSTEDRRAVVLELTRRGQRDFQALCREQSQLVRTALRVANARDGRAWVPVLRKIALALAQADDVFKQFCMQCGAHADGTCVLIGGDADCPYLRQGRRRSL